MERDPVHPHRPIPPGHQTSVQVHESATEKTTQCKKLHKALFPPDSRVSAAAKAPKAGIGKAAVFCQAIPLGAEILYGRVLSNPSWPVVHKHKPSGNKHTSPNQENLFSQVVDFDRSILKPFASNRVPEYLLDGFEL